MQKHMIALFCAAGMVVSSPVFAAGKLKVKPNAPARYVVKQGDTLWNISGKYLYRPWQWPALWNVNRSKVRNPHLIYPGQELHLTYVNGRPVLRASGKRGGKGGGIPTVKLRPGVVDLGSGYGIPTLNVDFYRLFMKHPQFVSAEEIAHAPRIVAGADSRTLYSKGDRVYADGPIEPGSYLVFRVKQDLTDPVSGKSLGKLAEFSGEVATLASTNTALDERDTTIDNHVAPEKQQKLRDKLREDEYYAKVGSKMVPVRTAQPMVITESVSEIMKGDYLLPKPDAVGHFNIMPHAPAQPVQAAVIDSIDGISESGFAQTVILNKGEADGVDEGTVLSVYKPNRVVKTEWNSPDEKAARFVNLPSEEVGLAMVYRTGRNVASAIILESKTNVSRGDMLREPGQDMDAGTETTVKEDGMIDVQPGLLDDADLHWRDVLDAVK